MNKDMKLARELSNIYSDTKQDYVNSQWYKLAEFVQVKCIEGRINELINMPFTTYYVQERIDKLKAELEESE